MKKMKFPKLTTKPKNTQSQGDSQAGAVAKPASFSQQLLGAVIIFMSITWAYSLFTEKKATPDVPLSQFAQLVNSREINSITVEGSSLTGEKKDGTKVSSKKEDGASVFTTLAAYGAS